MSTQKAETELKMAITFADEGLRNSKQFNEMSNVGSSKYVVNFHDGIKTYNDGSKFFDICIFKNKSKKNAFIKELIKTGYINTQ